MLHLVGCNLELYYNAQTYKYKKLLINVCLRIHSLEPF